MIIKNLKKLKKKASALRPLGLLLTKIAPFFHTLNIYRKVKNIHLNQKFVVGDVIVVIVV